MVLDFSVERNDTNNIPIVRLTGEVDIYTAPRLNEYLKEVISTEKNTIILNLEDIQYIDSTGLGTIAHAAHALAQQDGTLLVVCTKPSIKKIFDVSGLTQKNIHIFDSEDTALQSIK